MITSTRTLFNGTLFLEVLVVFGNLCNLAPLLKQFPGPPLNPYNGLIITSVAAITLMGLFRITLLLSRCHVSTLGPDIYKLFLVTYHFMALLWVALFLTFSTIGQHEPYAGFTTIMCYVSISGSTITTYMAPREASDGG